MKNIDFKNNEFQIMQELWQAYKTFYNPKDMKDEDFWDSVLKTFTQITEKYKYPFCTELAIVFMNDIERRANG